MLNRLAESQEQTVWFSLWDKVWNSDNLSQAMLEVILNGGSAGVDGQTTEQISGNWTEEQKRLQSELHQGHTIPRKRLLAEIQKRIADGKVMKLLEDYLEAGVWETGKGWQPTEQGTPQGSVISPLLSNIYLNPLDHKMAQKGYEMVRYADDAVVCCRTEAEVREALAEIAAWTERAGLKVHPNKTRIVSAVGKGGFDF